jgi:hypothetical protein
MRRSRQSRPVAHASFAWDPECDHCWSSRIAQATCSTAVRARPCAPADALPMHRLHRAEPRGAFAGRPFRQQGRGRWRRLPCRAKGRSRCGGRVPAGLALAVVRGAGSSRWRASWLDGASLRLMQRGLGRAVRGGGRGRRPCRRGRGPSCRWRGSESSSRAWRRRSGAWAGAGGWLPARCVGA